MSKTIEIKIDRSTLPSDNQKVEWQTYNELGTEEWKQGTFAEGDDLFLVGFEESTSQWDMSFDVFQWRALE